MTAPDVSVTTPEMLPVMLADATAIVKSTKASTATEEHRCLRIADLLAEVRLSTNVYPGLSSTEKCVANFENAPRPNDADLSQSQWACQPFLRSRRALCNGQEECEYAARNIRSILSFRSRTDE